jgi:hypothetical protein
MTTIARLPALFLLLLASVLAAYLATRFNNIMDMLQLVFAFVNAPLFGTFLLVFLGAAAFVQR